MVIDLTISPDFWKQEGEKIKFGEFILSDLLVKFALLTYLEFLGKRALWLVLANGVRNHPTTAPSIFTTMYTM